nr:MAG TPA: hypothetical protein [Caudoviricetes sp.]
MSTRNKYKRITNTQSPALASLSTTVYYPATQCNR